MRSINPVEDSVEIIKSSIQEIDELIKWHLESLAFPMDSWLEDRLLELKVRDPFLVKIIKIIMAKS